MRAVLLPIVLLVLVGCGRDQVRPNPPAPIVIEVPVKVYVPIDGDMTERCRWVRDAPPSEVFKVTAGRKKCLERYEGQFETIESVQGKPVPEG